MFTFIGIDPGLVHTGAVFFRLDPEGRNWTIRWNRIDGPNAAEAAEFCERAATPSTPVFIEAYRPRSHFGTDEKMVKAVHDFKAAIPRAKVLNNTGVKQVVKPELMRLLGVWDFGTRTHHQDLRAAARIGLYGALKDDELNLALTRFVIDHIDGRLWQYVEEETP